MKKWISENKKIIFFSLILSTLFLFPYLLKSFIPLGHDTIFHLSRIEGLATSIQEGEWLPSIYPYKNNNFGYASPLFYSDFFLIIPALLYLIFKNIYFAYLFTLFACTFITSFTIMKLTKTFTKKSGVHVLSAILYLFCNYRITNVYVRGALGEVFATAFLPLALLGIYSVLFEKKQRWLLLVLGFGGLLLSHNLSFALICFVFFFFILLNFKKVVKENRWISILKASTLTFLLTAFFLLPLLEQISSQEFYLHYYASTMDLKAYAIPLSTFFINKATQGYANVMALNVGIFLAVLPLIFLWLNKNKSIHPFLKQSILLGYIFMFLPWNIFPWEYLNFLRILQFPWRLTLIASLLLTPPAALAFERLHFRKWFIFPSILLLFTFDGLIRLTPVLSWEYGITPQTQYIGLIDGTYIDPNSTFYLRAELAGADYLPTHSIDYRNASRCVQQWNEDSSLTEINCTPDKQGTSLFFTTDSTGDFILPLTYYKGYQVYLLDDYGRKVEQLPTYKSHVTLVQFTTSNPGQFVCEYSGTAIQYWSKWISGITLLLLVFNKLPKIAKKKTA